MHTSTQRESELLHARPKSVSASLEAVPSRPDVEQEGFDTAAGVRGDLNALRLALRRVAEETDTVDSERRLAVQRRIDGITAEIDRFTTLMAEARQAGTEELAHIHRRTEELKAAVGRLEEESTLRTHHDRAGTEFHPVKYWLLAGVLAALTGYLVAFYPSVLYTAVFSNLGDDLQRAARTGSEMRDLFNGILNPRALAEAMHTPSALAWVVLFTALPLGIGVVTHSTIEARWRWTRKAAGLISLLALAFVIDGIIAYRIAQRLHEARYLTGVSDTPWASGMFLKDVAFWFVIFVGFGAYVVWGLVLSFYVEEDRKRHPERQAIRRRVEEVERIRLEISTLAQGRLAAEDEMKRREAELKRGREDQVAAQERAARELASRVVNWNELEARLDDFTQGWIRYLVHAREATAAASAAAEVVSAMKAELRSKYPAVGEEG